uniref:Uncharacterized protein n=1 Tax=Oryza rufipogon TaxID=4529 RepID=A0A0E0QJX5_ORYRU
MANGGAELVPLFRLRPRFLGAGRLLTSRMSSPPDCPPPPVASHPRRLLPAPAASTAAPSSRGAAACSCAQATAAWGHRRSLPRRPPLPLLSANACVPLAQDKREKDKEEREEREKESREDKNI